MLYPYAREANARTRARALGLGSTITRCRLGGWYVVGPVELDADGRRDRRLYGTNRAAWSVTRELDTIRARGASAPAECAAHARARLPLLVGAKGERMLGIVQNHDQLFHTNLLLG